MEGEEVGHLEDLHASFEIFLFIYFFHFHTSPKTSARRPAQVRAQSV